MIEIQKERPDMVSIMETLAEQIKLLTEWNKENIKIEPEQVRKNIETIIPVLKALADSSHRYF